MNLVQPEDKAPLVIVVISVGDNRRVQTSQNKLIPVSERDGVRPAQLRKPRGALETCSERLVEGAQRFKQDGVRDIVLQQFVKFLRSLRFATTPN